MLGKLMAEGRYGNRWDVELESVDQSITNNDRCTEVRVLQRGEEIARGEGLTFEMFVVFLCTFTT